MMLAPTLYSTHTTILLDRLYHTRQFFVDFFVYTLGMPAPSARSRFPARRPNAHATSG